MSSDDVWHTFHVIAAVFQHCSICVKRNALLSRGMYIYLDYICLDSIFRCSSPSLRLVLYTLRKPYTTSCQPVMVSLLLCLGPQVGGERGSLPLTSREGLRHTEGTSRVARNNNTRRSLGLVLQDYVDPLRTVRDKEAG